MASTKTNNLSEDEIKRLLEFYKSVNYELMASGELIRQFNLQLKRQKGQLYDLARVSKMVRGEFSELRSISREVSALHAEIERRDEAIADVCQQLNVDRNQFLESLKTEEKCTERIKKLKKEIKDLNDKRGDLNDDKRLKKAEKAAAEAAGDTALAASKQAEIADIDRKRKDNLKEVKTRKKERDAVVVQHGKLQLLERETSLLERDKQLHDVLNAQIEEGNILLEKREEKYNNIKKGLMASWGVAKNIANRWYEWQHMAYSTSRALGKDREQAEAFFNRSLRYTRELSKNYGMSYEQVTKFQSELSNTLGRAVDMSRQQIETTAAMAALSSPEDATRLVDEMDRFGGSIQDASFYMELTQERAQKLGLNPVKATKTIADNLRLASTYSFKSGIDGLSKMALEAQRLRVSMESIVQASDNFNTIEGAIENSAKLQMLGGKFAAFGGNPMANLYNATSSQEDFFESVKQMFSDNGVFNRRTGVVEIDPMTRRFIMEAAKSMGLSVNEALQMTQSSVKNKEISSRLRDVGFTDAQRAFIESKAQYDARTQSFKITDEYTGEEKDVSMLTPEDVVKLQANTIDEKHMFGDVRDIRDYLYNNVLGRQKTRAIRGMSYKENYEGMKEGIAATEVTAFNGIGKPVADLLNDTNSWLSKIYGWLTASPWLTFLGHAMGAGVYAAVSGVIASKIGDGLKYGIGGYKFDSQLNKATGGMGGGTASGTTTPPTRGSKTTQRGLGPRMRLFGMKYGRIGTALGATMLVAGTAYSMFGGDKGETGKSKELQELEKQTRLLEEANGRSGAGGIGTSRAMSASAPNVTINNSITNDSKGGALDTVFNTADMAAMPIGTMLAIDSMTGGRGAKALASKGGMAGAIGKNMLRKGVGVGMIAGSAASLAQGLLTEEGSTANKVLGMAGDALSFGSIGLALGGPIGAAIGGVLGLAKGWYDASKATPSTSIAEPEKFAEGGIVGGNDYEGDRVHARLNSGEMVLNRNQQSALYSSIKELSIKGPEVKSLPVVGAATAIRDYNTNASYQSGKTGRPSSVKMSLEVSGTIKLDLGGRQTSISADELLRSPEFKRQLADMVSGRLNESSNAGKRNLESQRNNVASQYMGIGR